MNDLITRLRKCMPPVLEDAEMCQEAADEIDRLEARCLKLYNANEKLSERIFKLEAVVKDFKGFAGWLCVIGPYWDAIAKSEEYAKFFDNLNALKDEDDE